MLVFTRREGQRLVVDFTAGNTEARFFVIPVRRDGKLCVQVDAGPQFFVRPFIGRARDVIEVTHCTTGYCLVVTASPKGAKYLKVGFGGPHCFKVVREEMVERECATVQG